MTPGGIFAGRAGLYAKYRPGYPEEVVDILRRETGLNGQSVVADIGAGTGISTRLLLPHVAKVYAIEPNAEMRAQAILEGGEFVSVDGTAEATTLADGSVDFVIAAQAFHWFRPEPFLAECRRILRPGGWLVLLWNMRKSEASPLVADYEQLLVEFGTNYRAALVSENWNEPAEKLLSGAGTFGHARLDNFQYLDYEGFEGRLLSASYAPLAGDPKHEPMLARLREIFDHRQVNGRVQFDYDTHIYWARL